VRQTGVRGSIPLMVSCIVPGFFLGVLFLPSSNQRSIVSEEPLAWLRTDLGHVYLSFCDGADIFTVSPCNNNII
jgi:hypothetical protein